MAIDFARGLTTTSTTMELSNRSLIRMATSTLVAGLLALPTGVSAAPPEPETAATEAQSPARVAFEQGLRAYEAADYAQAARRWTEAHSLMAQSPELSASRRVLGFDLAQAQVRAYEADGDRARLDAAKPLLEGYIAWVDRPEHTMDETETQDRQRAVELLAQIERENALPAAVPPPVYEAPAPSPPAPDPAPTQTRPNGTGLLIGGGVALAGGLASVGGAIASLAAGSKAESKYNDAAFNDDRAGMTAAERDGVRANAGFIVSAASALALTAAGVTMLAIGGVRRRRYVSASASVSPSSAGASFSMRF